MPYIAYPTTIPGPTAFECAPRDRRMLSENEEGEQKVRRRETDFHGASQLQWEFTREQGAIFNTWGRTTLKNWTWRFAVTLPGYGGFVQHVARFKKPPKWSHIGYSDETKGYWVVTAEIEIYGLALPPQTQELDPLTLLQSYFTGNTNDVSYYARGAGTLTGSVAVAGDELVINNVYDGSSPTAFLTYPDITLAAQTELTFELFMTWIGTPNVAYTAAAHLLTNAADPNSYRRFGYYGSAGRMVYDDSGFGEQYLSPGAFPANSHFAMTFASTGFWVHFNGTKVYAAGGDNRLPAGRVIRVQLGDMFGYTSGTANFKINAFRLRAEAVYPNADITPPADIPSPYV